MLFPGFYAYKGSNMAITDPEFRTLEIVLSGVGLEID